MSNLEEIPLMQKRRLRERFSPIFFYQGFEKLWSELKTEKG